MALTDLEIIDRQPYADGRSFGDTGTYERIDAIAHYAVDPAAAANRGIVDLDKAPRGSDGRVHFSGDATFLVPADPTRGNRALLVEVPNRGHRLAHRTINRSTDLDMTGRIHPGDGFLFQQGWSVAWCGWQWDVPRSAARMGLDAPRVPAELAEGQMQLRVQPNEWRADVPLTDQHVGTLGDHEPLRAIDVDDPHAILLVRDRWNEEPVIVPRQHWQFARDEGGSPIANDHHVWLEGGFEPGRIYDVVFRPLECPVVGAGLLAVRDFTSYLRRSDEPTNPAAGRAEHVIGEGQSQCGRFLRTFLYLGLNLDESEQQVFDGLLIHIAGGRRGEFNHRYAQPSVQPTPSFGHLFPFADDPQSNPQTGQASGLLDAQRRRGGVPRIFYTNTSSEYWRGDAGLSHIDLETHADVDAPAEVRRYLFASTQHGPGFVPSVDKSAFGTRGANRFNVIDYRPLFRAALTNLLDWVRGRKAPPPSNVPRFSDGTAASRPEVARTLASIPGFAIPDESVLPHLLPLDLGKRAAEGIGRFPARFCGEAYRAPVSAIDDDGNEIGGIRMPDVAVPVGTHTGFNPRHPTTGGEGQLLDYLGSTVVFAKSPAELRVGDTRAPLANRYRNREDYLEQVKAAAQRLVTDGYLLASDVELCVSIAGERYDACVETQ